MKILGIQDSHDAGIAYLEDGKIVFAINEERLSRIKLCKGFPKKSIEMLIKKYKVKPEEIDKIAIGSKYVDYVEFIKTFENEGIDKFNRKAISILSPLLGPFFKSGIWIEFNKFYLKIAFRKRKKEIKRELKSYGFKCPIKFIDHHLAHAASAYYTGGKDPVLIITLDAAGDALSATVSIGKNKELQRIKRVNAYNSLGKLYSYVTEICGFKAVRHEGKITGLAAYGKPRYLSVFNKMVIFKKGGFVNISNTKHEKSKEKILKEIGENFSKEDLAASVQQHLENECLKFIRYWLKKTGLRDVVLAGGVFANVKLNQRILELDNVDSIFIHPNMGDGGLALGAALYVNNGDIIKIEDVYFGPKYSEKEIENALKKSGLSYKKYDSVEKEIAKLINKGKVVARFNGRMEYGPRALGNRSILYHTKDRTVNDWLNKRLKRTEFMPFAPVTLEEHKDKYYLKNKGGEYAARFMTITFDCSNEMKKKCPAVVHVDNTARPQLINKKINTSYYNIVKEYYKLTGIPTVVNTSFNMHEEPIVCSPRDAIISFRQGNLDVLAIGDFIVKNEKNNISSD